jgi:pyruvate,water dikinase
MDVHKHTRNHWATSKSIYQGGRRGNDYPTASIRTGGLAGNVVSPPVFQIPASLVVTASAFREFMRKNRVDELVEGLLAEVDVKRLEELRHPAAQIQEVIRSSPLPDQVFDYILEGYREIGCGSTIVWPVTMPVELFHYSLEYQRFPYLEATGPEGTMEAIRSWWASLFEATAIFYREVNGQKHRDARITVAVQPVPAAESDWTSAH